MKKTIFISLIICAVVFSAYPQERLPGELAKIEARLLELKAQSATLDNYSPEKLLDFAELEKINRFVEQLEFNKRRFDLLIKQFNLFEDEIFPFLLKLSTEAPDLRDEIVEKIAEYSGQEEKSVLRIQDEINRTALHIERLEKKIERAQTASREKDIAEAEKQKMSAGEKTMNISARIQRLAEDQKNHLAQLTQERQKLKKLKENEKYQENKIAEKNNEVIALRKEARESKDIVKKRINDILAAVKEMRINGLEIPRLNTARTFIYLSETAREILAGKIENLKKEIAALENIRARELRDRLIKGVIIIVFAVLLVFILNRAARRISRKFIEGVEKSKKVDAHRKQRYQTLSSVILSFIKILSWTLAVLWVLGELDIDYAPFLVAAGGISLAIGFGAQSLVKDIVSGFFILMEEQFALGDFVEIEGKSGT
ncbi:MAG: mechanosensitive ion channel, partial [Candidatus Aminicenantes bacterium]|nr:mechanosensitive ion channel [Candidatus Aminicenantes bacterium]